MSNPLETGETPTDDALRRSATRRADAKIGFRTHALVYVLVNAGLAALNLLTSQHYLWFVFPLFGWGIGLLAHGLAVYGVTSIGREEMIEREMERLRQRSRPPR
jgi:hypothetical protein